MDDPKYATNEAKIKELYEKHFLSTKKQKKLNQTTVSCGDSIC